MHLEDPLAAAAGLPVETEALMRKVLRPCRRLKWGEGKFERILVGKGKLKKQIGDDASESFALTGAHPSS